jgi:hypothetical protein
MEKRTRVALTSGGDEPVPDSVQGGKHSVFAKSFMDVLKKNSLVLEAHDLAKKVRDKVVFVTSSYRIKQTPKFVTITKAGHDDGDFLFVPANLQIK